MAHLTLVGLSADKARLLLVDDSGTQHTLDIDAPLRAALRGDPSRLGQLEIDMDSALRPRDIQARIRAGETPEIVARAAQTTVDKIMPFAAPVLAERAHVADRAQRASVRRRTSEGGARTLGEAAETQLRTHHVAIDTVGWDAWKRTDGRWTLTATYVSGPRSGTGTFTFDAPGNFVIADDDDARWLVGELPDVVVEDVADDLSLARRRRLSAVSSDDQLPIGEDAIGLVSDVDPDASTADLTDTAARIRAEARRPAPAVDDDLGPEPPAEAFLDGVFARQNPSSPSSAEDRAYDDDGALVDGASAVEPVEEEAHEGPTRRQVKKTRGRASVPSWDEIMFGGGGQD